MSKLDVAFDAEVFSRTASLFTVKREAFSHGSVEMFATDIVRLLARSRATAAPANDTTPISAERITAFCEALVQPDPDAAIRFIDDRRAEGVTRNDIYLGYIVAAARCLGGQWEDNRLDFLQVTYGTGHLYALMRALRAERRPVRPSAFSKRCALFATVPGEDHGIGITVAADMFREAGWEIDLRTVCEHGELLEHIERTQPDIIGLSLSTKERLDALVRLVVATRIVVPRAVIGVAPGQDLGEVRVRDIADIDLVFDDVHSARLQLERLLPHD